MRYRQGRRIGRSGSAGPSQGSSSEPEQYLRGVYLTITACIFTYQPSTMVENTTHIMIAGGAEISLPRSLKHILSCIFLPWSRKSISCWHWYVWLVLCVRSQLVTEIKSHTYIANLSMRREGLYRN